MRFSMILEMVDRLSAPAKRARGGVTGLRSSIRDMAQQVRGAARDVNNGSRSIEHFQRRASRLRQVALGRTFQAIGSSARSMGRDLDGLVRRLRLVERGGEAARSGLRKLGGGAFDLLKTGVFAGGTAVAGAGAFAMFDLFRTAGQFEQYQMQLDHQMGSAKAGKQTMGWISEFAAKTPFELDEVVQSFKKLKDAGLDPTNGSLLAVGDAAAGMSEPLLRAAEAMADAANGQFERLVDLGIQASTQGNRVRLTWMRNERQYDKVVDKADKLAVAMAVAAAWNDKFAGSQQRQATSLFGIISNLKDQWSRFLIMVADAGVFDFVKGKLQGLLDSVIEMAANGELEKWAEGISDKLIKAWEWGEKFIDSDWDATIQKFKDIADAVGVVADAVLALKRAKDALDGAEAWVDDTLYRGFKPGATPTLDRLFSGGKEKPAATKPRAPSRLPSESSLLRSLPRQSKVDIGGALKIDVSAAPGLAVKATPIAVPGSGLAMETRTGRTMRSAA